MYMNCGGFDDICFLMGLGQVFQLKVNGVSFRLIPEASQVKNALKVRYFWSDMCVFVVLLVVLKVV